MDASELLDNFVNTTQEANREVGRAGTLIQTGWKEYNRCEANQEEMLERIEKRLDRANEIIEEEEENLEDILENRFVLKRISAESGFGEGYSAGPVIYDELNEEIEKYKSSMKALYATIEHERLTGNF